MGETWVNVHFVVVGFRRPGRDRRSYDYAISRRIVYH